jgi:hypothetical protein
LSECEDGSTATTGMCPDDDDPKCVDDGKYVCKEAEDEDENKENLIDYEDGCLPGSANPEEGCTLEGYQCGPDGCGYYSHGVCETCTNEEGSQVDPCVESPDAEGCQEPLPPTNSCEENPSLPECQLEDVEAAFADEEPIVEGDVGDEDSSNNEVGETDGEEDGDETEGEEDGDENKRG